MRILGSLLLGAIIVSVVMGPICLIVPNTASAVEYSGTSPSFGTDTVWSLYVGWFAAGDIIEWDWTTYDSLSFSLLYTVGATTTQLWGFSSSDGLVVESAGHYGLWWYNNNLFFSATVSYWVAGFTPSTTIATPSDGALLNSRTISVQGVSDSYSTAVLVGRDAFHLTDSSWSGDNWAADDVALNEGQNTILVRTCYWLDYYGYKNVTYDQTIHVTVDAVVPELQITQPVNDSYQSGDIEVTWQCSDSNGIVKTEIKFDAWGWQDVIGTTYVASMPDGVHTVQVRVTDPAGNQATRTVTFTKDTDPPELAIVSPVISSSGTYLQGLVNITWQCSDNTGIARQEMKIDESDWQEVATSSYTLQFADGNHLVQVRVTDLAGNNATGEFTFVTDTVAPDVHVYDPLMDAKISESDVTIFFVAEDERSGVDHLEVQVDGGNWLNVGHDSTYQLTGLEDGWHSVTVKAVDQSGNTATKTVGFGIYTSIWSTNGPYQGIPLFGLIAAIIVVALVITLLLRKKKGGPAATSVTKEESSASSP